MELTVEGDLAIVRLQRPHGNAINDELARDLVAACREVERDDALRGILLAASGKLFSPGLDLLELVDLDRSTMERFLEDFNACVLELYRFPKPMVGALHGHALAGGCVFSLTADWRVLSEHAMVGLNESRVGVAFPFGVAMILRESVPVAHLEEIVLFGRNYTGDEAVRIGLVHEIHAAEGFEAFCLSRLAELASRDPRALSITKRYLRSAAVERIREQAAGFDSEFLDSWFSEGTRQRIGEIVANLRRR